MCIQHYKAILRTIFDEVPVIPQIRRSLADNAISCSITSNWLCLQCPMIIKEEDITKHGNKKSHRFCESIPLP